MKKDKLTQKGLFERLIRLETKLDISADINHKTANKFTFFALVIAILEIINMGFNYILYIRQ